MGDWKLDDQCDIVEDCIVNELKGLDADDLLEIAKLVIGESHPEVIKLEKLINEA